MSYNTRNIKNTCFLLCNDSKFTKTEPTFGKCSAKCYSLKYWAFTSDKKTVNNIFERVFFSKVAGLPPACNFTNNDSSTRFLTTSMEQLFCRTCLDGCFYETEHYKAFTVAALFFTKDKLSQIILCHISAKWRYLVAPSQHFFFCHIKN